ncbi:MAG: DUF1634 domain-containing protein [Phycisphaerae bacterium]|nr:DUF1634 domain-containing protein [Phycisphaerae bacterium]
MEANTKPIDERPKGSPEVANEFVIQDVSGWVLRIGVAVSVAVMILGLTLSFVRHPPTVKAMESTHFKAGLAVIWHGVIHGHGVEIIEMGIFLLVLTPIMRVAMSVILFAFYDHDWLYTLVTLGVLLLTLASLLFLR